MAEALRVVDVLGSGAGCGPSAACRGAGTDQPPRAGSTGPRCRPGNRGFRVVGVRRVHGPEPLLAEAAPGALLEAAPIWAGLWAAWPLLEDAMNLDLSLSGWDMCEAAVVAAVVVAGAAGCRRRSGSLGHR